MQNAPKSQVGSRRVGRVVRPRRDTIPVAVALVAHVAPTFFGLLPRLALLACPRQLARVGLDVPGAVVPDRPVRCGPLPHVAQHVV